MFELAHKESSQCVDSDSRIFILRIILIDNVSSQNNMTAEVKNGVFIKGLFNDSGHNVLVKVF